MRIGLISDTHIPTVADELPAEVLTAFKGVDLIMHAGDIYAVSVLDVLEKVAPVIAARGDDDPADTVTDKRVKEKHFLELEGTIVWLIHEKPFAPMTPTFLSSWWESRLDPEQNRLGKPDIVVFGHEHRTFTQHMDGVLFISPGSPTFLNYERGPGTLGILELNEGPPDFRIIKL